MNRCKPEPIEGMEPVACGVATSPSCDLATLLLGPPRNELEETGPFVIWKTLADSEEQREGRRRFEEYLLQHRAEDLAKMSAAMTPKVPEGGVSVMTAETIRDHVIGRLRELGIDPAQLDVQLSGKVST